MAQPSTLVSNVRNCVGNLLDSIDCLNAQRAQYDALGGSSFVDSYFEDSEGNPRTDIDITSQEFLDALSSVAAINTLMSQGHATNLNKLR